MAGRILAPWGKIWKLNQCLYSKSLVSFSLNAFCVLVLIFHFLKYYYFIFGIYLCQLPFLCQRFGVRFDYIYTNSRNWGIHFKFTLCLLRTWQLPKKLSSTRSILQSNFVSNHAMRPCVHASIAASSANFMWLASLKLKCILILQNNHKKI